MLKNCDLDVKQQFLALFETVVRLEFSKDDYVICGSGPLAIRNVRAAYDIDLWVTSGLWSKLIEKYPTIGKKQNCICIDHVEIWKDWMNLTDRQEEVFAACEIFENLPFMSLEHCIEWKAWLRRPKDLEDIEIIQTQVEIVE